MTKPKNFKLTLEPEAPLNPVYFYGGLEGLIGINVNGIEVLADRDRNTQKEAIGYTIDWILKEFQDYILQDMPENMIPAVDLYWKLSDVSEKYHDIHIENGKFKSAILKHPFGNWLAEHNFGYPYLKLPIIFQRRGQLMEVSWKFNGGGYYKNEEGCEYVPLNAFKREILDVTEQSLRKIKASGKVYDYHQHEKEFLKLLEQARTVI